MQHIHCPYLCKGNSVQVHFLFFLLYQQNKPAVLPSQKLQPKLELHTKCFILYSENAGNSIYAESNFQIHGASCFIIHGSDHLEGQTTSILTALASYAEIVSICYLCKSGYSSKKNIPLNCKQQAWWMCDCEKLSLSQHLHSHWKRVKFYQR